MVGLICNNKKLTSLDIPIMALFILGGLALAQARYRVAL